jgi:hypothetical protein
MRRKCSLNNPHLSLSLLLQNSIRHNLSLHSRFVRVQNEGTGKSSWWMLNPDAKPGGKTCRRRPASVEGGPGAPPRGPDFKRRGRTKKNASNINTNAMLRNGGGGGGASGHLNSSAGGADTTPSPNGPVQPGHMGNGQSMVDLYPASPSLHPHQYPFPGRMSPPLGGGAMHPGGDHPPFGYPGQQDWPGDYQCGPPVPPYFVAGKLIAKQFLTERSEFKILRMHL